MPLKFKTHSSIVVLFLAVCIIILPVQIGAQEQQQKQPSQEEVMKMMGMMGMMGTMMGTMMETVMEAMFKVLAKPENAERLATFTKNYYDALIAKGFSKEEALRMATTIGMPALHSKN